MSSTGKFLPFHNQVVNVIWHGEMRHMKPCPFCGNAKQEGWLTVEGGSAYCHECGTTGPGGKDPIDAWNARQPEAKMLDLGGVERWNFVSRDYNYAEMVRRHDGAWVRYSDLQNLLAPASSVPTVDMLTDVVYQDNTALLTNVEALYIARAVHALLTKGRGGA